jgi:hypothetical protein
MHKIKAAKKRYKIYMSLLLLVVLMLNISSKPDEIARHYIDDALKASAVAYIAARGINGTISVLQDIEIDAGVISGSPGELLDPLNDLIERFSTVMLFATASLGIQKVLLHISGASFLQIIIGVLVLTLLGYTIFKVMCQPYIIHII